MASSTVISSPNAAGTLMWIGQRDHIEFKNIFRQCESQVPQLALRRDLSDAILRPASHVAGIIVTRQSRKSPRIDLLNMLVESYPDASLVQLLGSMCQGERPRQHEPFGSQILYWHQADQFLPQYLSHCAITARSTRLTAKSVAVVTQSAQIAEPLMDLASSVGAAAFWCRQPNPRVARNLDAVWWDDSAVNGGNCESWKRRLATINPVNISESKSGQSPNKPTHVWLTNYPRTQLANAAYSAGVDYVISKPAKIDALLQTIQPAPCEDIGQCEDIDQSGASAPSFSRAA